MLARLKGFLSDTGDGSRNVPHGQDELQLAAAVLMVEAGRMDGLLDEEEEHRIAELVRDRFELDSGAAGLLLEAAKAATEDSGHIYPFTRTVARKYDHDERINMIEMLWEVVYADGELHEFEANLLRRAAGLLYVTDRESGAARKRVLARTAAEGT
jgi:uncharacterized tellurite resistance protein B-like protein